MKVFWSWQSDTHAESGRHFVRAALAAAIDRLADQPDLEDAERAEVDSDTSNVSGHPHIGETVLRKIRECSVFVADLTPVGKTAGGKKLPNPNVMIELGYAFAQVGLEQVVLVMNQAEGARLSALPFDLRFWRAPISYSLKRDATEEERAEVLEGLVEDVAAALGRAWRRPPRTNRRLWFRRACRSIRRTPPFGLGLGRRFESAPHFSVTRPFRWPWARRSSRGSFPPGHSRRRARTSSNTKGTATRSA